MIQSKKNNKSQRETSKLSDIPLVERFDRKPFVVSRPSRDTLYRPPQSSLFSNSRLSAYSKNVIKTTSNLKNDANTRLSVKKQTTKKVDAKNKPEFNSSLPSKFDALNNFKKKFGLKSTNKSGINKKETTVKPSTLLPVQKRDNKENDTKHKSAAESRNNVPDWKTKFQSIRNRVLLKSNSLKENMSKNRVYRGESLKSSLEKSQVLRKSVHFQIENQINEIKSHPRESTLINDNSREMINFETDVNQHVHDINNSLDCDEQMIDCENKNRTMLAGSTPFSSSSGSCGTTPGRKNYISFNPDSEYSAFTSVIRMEDSQLMSMPESNVQSSTKKRRRRKSLKSPMVGLQNFTRKPPDSFREPYYLRSCEKSYPTFETSEKRPKSMVSFSLAATSSPNDINQSTLQIAQNYDVVQPPNGRWFVPDSPYSQKTYTR